MRGHREAVAPRGRYVEMGAHIEPHIVGVYFPAREHMRSAQHVGQTVALDQEDLETAGPVPQHHHAGGWARLNTGLEVVQLHMPRLPEARSLADHLHDSAAITHAHAAVLAVAPPRRHVSA
jgi:hypothetical protein